MQFFPTAEESMEYYKRKRCVDGKGHVLPCQIVSLLLAMQRLFLGDDSYTSLILIFFFLLLLFPETCQVF